MNRIPEHQIRDFMRFLRPIQMRLIEKYGKKAIYEWRQARLNRRTPIYMLERDIAYEDYTATER